MNRVNLTLCVIPSDIELAHVKRYNPATCGKVFSTLTDIKVNKTENGYGILYHTDDIKTIDMDVLGNNIIKLFMKNIPNTIIDIQIHYLFEIVNEYGDESNEISLSVINSLLTLENKFSKLPSEDGTIPFRYIRSDDMTKIINDIINNYKDLSEDDDDDDDDEDEDGDDDYEDDSTTSSVGLHSYFESFGLGGIDVNDDDDDEDEDGDSLSFLDQHTKNKKRKSYQESRIFHDAKNPKRSYNRHGVIITDKDTKKKDEKILKAFLKEFFPGDSEWKKEFRHDVLKRWMKMYCVTKKDLKELERAHRKAQNAKRGNVHTEKTLDFTRRLFNVPIDRWNDPSK